MQTQQDGWTLESNRKGIDINTPEIFTKSSSVMETTMEIYSVKKILTKQT